MRAVSPVLEDGLGADNTTPAIGSISSIRGRLLELLDSRRGDLSVSACVLSGLELDALERGEGLSRSEKAD